MEISTDRILQQIKNNRYTYDISAQKNDVELICQYLRLKYNSEELKNISVELIKHIERCNDNPHLWLANY